MRLGVRRLDRLPLRSLVRTLPPLRGLTVLNERESRQNRYGKTLVLQLRSQGTTERLIFDSFVLSSISILH